MPRVYVRKAGKDYPSHGIKKGDTYYAWSFYRQPEMKSKSRPKPSQLTNVESQRTMLAAYEVESVDGPEDVRSIIEQLEEARDMEQEKYDNLSEYFPDGEKTYACENNVSSLEDAIGSLEEIESELEDYLSTLDEDGEPGEETEEHEHHDRDWMSDVMATQPDWE